jgi:hypothetical protein
MSIQLRNYLNQQHAKNWNILVLKAAIYLIALPELKPELFKQAHTEHFNTVKRLFQRFRTANKNLDTEKNIKIHKSINVSGVPIFKIQHRA